MINVGLASMFYKYSKGRNDWTEWEEATRQSHKELTCCRNDSDAFQVLVGGDEELMVTVSEDPLFWKGGPVTIARLAFEVDDQIDLKVNVIGLMEDDDRRYKADILLDRKYAYVGKREPQSVFVECIAGPNAKPGTYQGRVKLYTRTLFADEILAGECTFSLNVKALTLPEPRDYQLFLDLWQRPSNISRQYDVELWTDEHFAVMEEYMEQLGKLGQKCASVFVSDIPWSGHRSYKQMNPTDMFEYSMVRVTKDGEGDFSYDFSAMDRYVEMAERHGIAGEITVFGLLTIWLGEDAGYGKIIEGFPDGCRIRYFDQGDSTFKYIHSMQDFTLYLRALGAHIQSKEWRDRVRLVSDEPSNLEVFEETLKMIRKELPFEAKVAIGPVAFMEKQIEGISDYSVHLDYILREHDRFNQLKSQMKNGKVTFYVSNHPKFPNSYLMSPGLEARLLPWFAEWLQLEGMLRWNFTNWTDDPWSRATYNYPSWNAGEMYYVYPGKRGVPVLSLRYKWLEKGIRDFEKMQILKEQGHGDAVERALQKVILQPYKIPDGIKGEKLYSLDESDYELLNDSIS